MSTLPAPVEVARIQKPGDLRIVLAYTERQILDFGASEYRRGKKEAAAEIERLQADAARYRWLRDAPIYSGNVGSLVELWLYSRPTAPAVAIDAAIDAAIAAYQAESP